MRVGLLAVLPLVATVAFLSACRGGGDCLSTGECECRLSSDCPEGLDCIDGRCGRLGPPKPPTLSFGQPCLDDSECQSGHCLPRGPGNGGVCTRRCDDEPCPDGYECKTHHDGNTEQGVRLCVQEIPPRLCLSCASDNQCNAIGDLCLEAGDGGRFCGMDCSQAPCPEGFSCKPVPAGSGTARQCVPKSGSCSCSAANVGMKRSCSRSNAYGTCFGVQECILDQPVASWSECDAPEPSPEVCNGMDDDCDGLVDTEDPGIDVTGLPPEPPYPACTTAEGPACLGRWNCLPTEGGGYGWVCAGTELGLEQCNGLDDDCNGVADDPFVDGAGRYVHPEHCGGCGGDCRKSVEHLLRDESGQVAAGAVTCAVRDGKPACVPLRCEPGYYPYPESHPVICARLVSPACQPCTANADCRVGSDLCTMLPDDVTSHCLQSCSPLSPYAGCTGAPGQRDCCPEGYVCSDYAGGKYCLPESGTCSCNERNAGASRPCLLAGSGGQVCLGEQQCSAGTEGTYSWSDCLPADWVVEVCDYMDNDCDDRIDEDFVDDEGNYSQDAHCGGCNNDCTARWDRERQHAIGACIKGDTGFDCALVACTTEQWRAWGRCRTDTDCEGGQVCSPEIHHCIVPQDQCPSGTCALACASDADCAVLGPYHRCLQGLCTVEIRFENTNGKDADGCECGRVASAQGDEPDVLDGVPAGGEVYLDENCDGMDGNAQRALFVSASAPPGGDGSRTRPFDTIGRALSAFDPARHDHILVAAGVYTERIVLEDGVRLYGGYSSDFSRRDVVLYPSVIKGEMPLEGEPPGTVYAEGAGAGTVMAGFTIYGYDVIAPPAAGRNGISSYAVYLKDCSGLLFANNFVYGGKGGPGADGAPGAPGRSGSDGQAGRDSIECNSADCFGMQNSGGPGGTNPSCPQANGHAGATARPYCHFSDCTQDYHGSLPDGRGGSDSIYNDSPDPSLCKYDCQVSSGIISSNGSDAGAGEDGSPGDGGGGCTDGSGSVTAGLFAARPGGDGSAGTDGQGGGGGGAGGAVINYNSSPPCSVGNPYGDLGASGGGGGAGGCRGSGGQGGGGGGGSFGIFLYFTHAPAHWPRIRANRITRGTGGRGGNGGTGGQGGLGGQGGRGGFPSLPAWCAGAGGAGGRGGDGGAGGGGGGGCGGVSYGLATNLVDSTASPFFLDNSFGALPGAGGGSGGLGGGSPAGQQYSGEPGAEGASGDWWIYGD